MTDAKIPHDILASWIDKRFCWQKYSWFNDITESKSKSSTNTRVIHKTVTDLNALSWTETMQYLMGLVFHKHLA